MKLLFILIQNPKQICHTNISKKHWANTEMVIKFLKNKNPALLLKMINSFKNNIKDIQKNQTVSQDKQHSKQETKKFFNFHKNLTKKVKRLQIS